MGLQTGVGLQKYVDFQSDAGLKPGVCFVGLQTGVGLCGLADWCGVADRCGLADLCGLL